MPRSIWAVSVTALTFLVLAGCSPSSGSSNGPIHYAPRFESASCPFPVTGGALPPSDIRCGYLVVPENRQVDTGRTIKVAVAVIRAQSPHPAPDPLVDLIGGPGSSDLGINGPSAVAHGVGPTFLWNRDLILVDQRGAGFSQPSLACQSYEDLQMCRQRLVKRFVDVSAYNTVENAADIADLRTALGYREINVSGVSYGSTLALQLMRDHPQGIRSVMMNGITGPTFNTFNDQIPNTWHGLQQIFNDCAADATCNGEYPHLARTFINLLARLQAHPVHLPNAGTLDAVTLWWWLNDYIASPANVGAAPSAIQNMAQGDFSSYVQDRETQQANGPTPVTAGMFESMTCSEWQAQSSPARIATRAQAVPVPSAVRRALIAGKVAGLHDCSIWRVPSTSTVNHTYFHSAIPTLLLPGRYEPKTSFAQAYPLARHLGHSYVVPLPTMSHEISWSGCTAMIIGEFLDHPDRKPDSSCTADMKMLWQ